MGMVAPPPPPRGPPGAIYTQQSSGISNTSSVTLSAEIEFSNAPPIDRDRGFSQFGVDPLDSHMNDLEEMDEDVPIPMNINVMAAAAHPAHPAHPKTINKSSTLTSPPPNGPPAWMQAPGPPPGRPLSDNSGRPLSDNSGRPLSDNSGSATSKSKNKFEYAGGNGDKKETRKKSVAFTSAATATAKDRTNSTYGTRPLRSGSLASTRKSRTSTTHTAGRKTRTNTDLSRQPSVAEYTESTITEERVLEGRFWQRVGFFLLLTALCSFSVSMYATSYDLVNVNAERLIREKCDLPVKEWAPTGTGAATCDYHDEAACTKKLAAFTENYGRLYLPKYNEYYLFNVRNAAMVESDMAKPDLKEMGPYVFMEMIMRVDVSFNVAGNDDDYTGITYKQLVKQIYVPDEEYRTKLDDRITMPNEAYVRQMYRAEGYGLSGEEYLTLKATSAKLTEIKDFYTSSTNARRSSPPSQKELYYLADSLWRKMFPDVMLDLYKELRASASSMKGVSTWNEFMTRWSGDCTTSGGCIYSGPPGVSSGGAIAKLLDPGICPSYSEWLPSSSVGGCNLNTENIIDQKVLQIVWGLPGSLFNPEYEFSFMAGAYNRQESDRPGMPAGAHHWFENDEDILMATFVPWMTSEQYDKIRNWVVRISEDGRYHAKISSLFNSYVGTNLGDSPKDYRNAAVMQWATGKVLGRGGVKSMYDGQKLNEGISAADGTTVPRWDYEQTDCKYTEFGVWQWRTQGKQASFTVSQAKALIDFLGGGSDTTKFWSMYADTGGPAPALADEGTIPGTGITVKLAKQYVDYIRETFVAGEFNVVADHNGLFPTRSAGEWIQGFREPINQLMMDPHDPRQYNQLSPHQEFTHPHEPEVEVESPDDLEGRRRRHSRRHLEEEKEELVVYPPAQCTSSADRTEPVVDDGGTAVFDVCEWDASGSVFLKKGNTYRTGMETMLQAEEGGRYDRTLSKNEMLKYKGYSELPAAITGGKPLVIATGALDLLGEGRTPQTAIGDGRWFPPMNTVTDCAAQECDLVVLHDRTMMPLIFRAHEDMIGFHKLGTKKLTLHDEYWIKGSSNEGGVAFPFHDDFEFVNDKYPGLLDISRVKGTPMFLSLPHFHSTSGDTYFKYGRSFQGLEPDASAHASSMLVEYALGLAVSTDIKLQYNIVLPPRAGMFQNEMKAGDDALMFPMYWLHEKSHISSGNADWLNMVSIYSMFWIEFTLIPLSIIFTMIMVGGGLCLIRRGGWMTVNASNRINEAGLRFHQMNADMADAKRKASVAAQKQRQDRRDLEKRIQSGFKVDLGSSNDLGTFQASVKGKGKGGDRSLHEGANPLHFQGTL